MLVDEDPKDQAEAPVEDNPVETEENPDAQAENEGGEEEAPAEEAEGEQEAQEGEEGAEQVDPEVEKALGKFKTKDGQLDLKKVAKSVKEAQAQFTKSRQELKAYAEKATRFDQFQGLYQTDPEFQKNVADAIARKSGQVAPKPTTPQVAPEELDKQISAAAAKNDWKTVTKIASQPLESKVERLEAELQAARQEQKKEAQKAAVEAERDAFEAKHGKIITGDADPELKEAIHEVYARGLDVPFEDARKIALMDLGRTDKQQPTPKPQPGRQAAMAKTGAPVKSPKVTTGKEADEDRKAREYAAKHGLTVIY